MFGPGSGLLAGGEGNGFEDGPVGSDPLQGPVILQADLPVVVVDSAVMDVAQGDKVDQVGESTVLPVLDVEI